MNYGYISTGKGLRRLVSGGISSTCIASSYVPNALELLLGRLLS